MPNFYIPAYGKNAPGEILRSKTPQFPFSESWDAVFSRDTAGLSNYAIKNKVASKRVQIRNCIVTFEHCIFFCPIFSRIGKRREALSRQPIFRPIYLHQASYRLRRLGYVTCASLRYRSARKSLCLIPSIRWSLPLGCKRHRFLSHSDLIELFALCLGPYGLATKGGSQEVENLISWICWEGAIRRWMQGHNKVHFEWP